ncbi:MAG: YedE-related selenium metabolism membrane protein [Christensenellaceae bacterium]|jgi:YedE family putative selenium metabolism protein|nr:YedE-related selenium metabolism membrane protein [Christensenellaceae bacterium]
MQFIKKHWQVIVTGLVVGLVAVALTALGNPKNMGICTACFLRDTVGGLGLHRAEVVQYIRPEILGIVLGALAISLIGKEFAPKGGSAPMLRFVLGFCVMIGALMFLGCPLRMVIRIGGGDLNAIIGLVGFALGIGIGIIFLNKGFSLKRSYDLPKLEGFVPSAIALGLLALLLFGAGLLFFSESGPGSLRAPIAISLIAGALVGILLQRSRLCMVGGIRDVVMFKDAHLLYGFIAMIVAVLIGNLVVGNGVKFSFADQPIAHADALWNLLGMLLVGFASVLLGGCPLRQLTLAGSGNTDSGVAVLGMAVGAAVAHNFKLASSADGPTAGGRVAVLICLVVVAIIGFANLQKQKD